MRTKTLYTLCFLLISLSSYSQNDTLRVLFLGNSYTGVNNLPQITQSLAAAANKTLIVDRNTPGGYTLDGHSTNTISLSKIKQGGWDFVILQEQSQIPTIDFYRYNSMYPGAQRLNDTIKKYNPCGKVVMYMTWGRRFGGQQCDVGSTNCSPVFVDFSHMQDSLESAYVEIADSMDAYVSPVGIAWKNVIEDTSIVLHSSDNSHPNYTGSYLTACVFHSILWNETPVGLTFFGSLSYPLATYLQTVADSTVFHSYSNWNRDVDDVIANYNYTIFNDSVQFTNLSQSLSPTNYLWDFGDGNTSFAANPFHIYTSNQVYTASLVAEHCSIRDTIAQAIQINTVGLETLKLQSLINVFPNPFDAEFELSIDKNNLDLTLQIVNATGKVIESFDVKKKQKMSVSLSLIPSGSYFLILYNNANNEQATFKVVKK